MSVYLDHGRKIVWAHSLFTLYDNWTDGKLTWGDVTSPLYFGLATLAFVIPDPGTQLIGTLPGRTPHLIFAGLSIRVLEDLGFFGDAGFAGRKGGEQTKTVGLDYIEEWFEEATPLDYALVGMNIVHGLNQLSGKVLDKGEQWADSRFQPKLPIWARER